MNDSYTAKEMTLAATKSVRSPGYLACPICNEDTPSVRVLGKTAYVGHRRFLKKPHKWRRSLEFNGVTENKDPPREFNRDAIHDSIARLPNACERVNIEFGGVKLNLNVLHAMARQDLKSLGFSKVACARLKLKTGIRARASGCVYLQTSGQKKVLFSSSQGVKLPVWVRIQLQAQKSRNDTNITGLKSHDCHIMMQRLLPYGLQQYLPPDVAKPLIELCLFFKQICSQTLMVDDMLKAQSKVIDILCNLELIYPPAFFDIMIHLVIHLPLEAIFGGPIRPRSVIRIGSPRIEESDMHSELFALACGHHQLQSQSTLAIVIGVRFVVLSRDERSHNSNEAFVRPGSGRRNMVHINSVDAHSVFDVVDEDDDIIDEEDPIPHDLADSDDEDLVNLDIDDGVNVVYSNVSAMFARGAMAVTWWQVYDRPPFTPDSQPVGGVAWATSKGTRKPNLGGRRAGWQHTRQETRNKSGPVTIRPCLTCASSHGNPIAGHYIMAGSANRRECPSLIHTFFLTHTVNGVFLNPEDKALYDEMLRLQGLGSNTETGVPYTEDEIMAIVRGGKQRGHIPGVGRVLPRKGSLRLKSQPEMVVWPAGSGGPGGQCYCSVTTGEIILKCAEKEGTWTVNLGVHNRKKSYYVRRGLHEFCIANGLEAGNIIKFELIRDKGKPVAVISILSEKETRKRKAAQIACFKSIATACSIKKSVVNVPRDFAMSNGFVNMNSEEMIVMDEKQRLWLAKVFGTHKRVHIRVFKDIWVANGFKAGDEFVLKLVDNGKKLLMNLQCDETVSLVYATKMSYLTPILEGNADMLFVVCKNCRLTPQLHEKMIPVREHECNESFNLKRQPALS
ncbi:zinc finger, PHD-type containing protein [Tanacetum coccineum]